MSGKKQPILKRFNWNEYFEAQRLLSNVTFVITPQKSFFEMKGQPLTIEQLQVLRPALINHNPKGFSKDGRHVQ